MGVGLGGVWGLEGLGLLSFFFRLVYLVVFRYFCCVLLVGWGG